MTYKFEKLEVWDLALDYQDIIFSIGNTLPKTEEYNLKSQITRAATSIALNIAEGSTCQSDAEQARFLIMSIRSQVETVACLHIIRRRNYLQDPNCLREAYRASEKLFAKLNAFRSSLIRNGTTVREIDENYETKAESGNDFPF